MLAAGLVLSWVCGILTVRLLLGPFSPWWRPTLLAGSIGAGLGTGLSSLVFFLLLLFGAASRGNVLVTEGIVATLLVLANRQPLPEGRGSVSVSGPRWPLALAALAVSLALGSFFLLYSLGPHGDWDAWAIWNLKARFLFLAEEWREGLSPSLAQSHPDYPLLIPGAVARLWTWTGAATTAEPASVALLFLAATAGVLTGVLWRLRGPTQAALGCMLLAGAGSFVRVASSQYADVPVAFFLLASVAAITISESGRTAALAGLCASLAAWTKNEGLMLTAAVLAARFVVSARLADLRRASRAALWFAAGAAPVVSLTLWFKIALAPVGDLARSASASSPFARLTDPSRYITILEAVLGELWRFGNFPVSLLIVLPVYLWLVGRSPLRSDPAAATGALTLVLASLGYGAVYLLAPDDLKWQLQTSLSRLFVQCWPLAVLVFFLIARAPISSRE